MVSKTTRSLVFIGCCALKRTMAVCLAILCIPAFLLAQETAIRQDPAPTIRIALSAGSFTGLNHNDVLAAIKTWAKAILKNRGLDMYVEVSIISRPEDLDEVLRTGQADAASMAMNEFLELKVKPEYIYLASRKASFTERYVILVHRNSGIANVGDLRGRNLLLFNSPRMSLAPAWVAGLMGLPKTEFVGMTRTDSPSRTVLPVFFRQKDASVVTSDVFEISCELNPQLKKDLQVLATSADVVPAGFFFRTGYASDARDKLEDALLSLHETPAGQQVLTMFQGDGMVKQPISCLESSRQLWDERGRSRRPGSN